MSTRAQIEAWFEQYITDDGSPCMRKILQNSKRATVAGTTAATNIALADAETNAVPADSIITGCIGHTAGAAGSDDLTNEATVTAAGQMQCSTTNTTGMDLTVDYIEPPI